MSKQAAGSRERVLERVRRALAGGGAAGAEARAGGDLSGGAPAAPPAFDEALVRLAGPDDDLVALFARRATEIGATVRTIASADLAGGLAGLLEEIGACTAVSALDLPEAAGLAEAAARRGVRVARAADVPLRVAPDASAGAISVETADVGITGVAWALAETGTLVCTSDREERSVSLMPPVHIAVVRASDIVPDLVDAVRALGARASLPSAVTLITGPSKTADIEGILVTGVHGPGRLCIVLVPDR